MDCESARVAISALLDSEEPGVEHGQLNQHLARCERCRRWREDAHEVTRRFRLAPAEAPTPGKTLLGSASLQAVLHELPTPVPATVEGSDVKPVSAAVVDGVVVACVT